MDKNYQLEMLNAQLEITEKAIRNILDQLEKGLKSDPRLYENLAKFQQARNDIIREIVLMENK